MRKSGALPLTDPRKLILPSRVVQGWSGNASAGLQLTVKPRSGERPPAFGGRHGDAEGRGGLRRGQAGEEAKLNQLGLFRLLGREAGQGVVEVQKVLRGFGHAVELLKRHAPRSPAVFDGLLAARMLNEDAAHGLGSRCEEVPAAVPVWLVLTGLTRGAAYQTQVGLVDQGSGLKRLPGRLLGQPLGGELAQLCIDEREQLARRGGVAWGVGLLGWRFLAHHRPPEDLRCISRMAL